LRDDDVRGSDGSAFEMWCWDVLVWVCALGDQRMVQMKGPKIVGQSDSGVEMETYLLIVDLLHARRYLNDLKLGRWAGL
jgi:hypothetical protein